MKPLYNQLMDSKSAPRVAPKANTTQLGTAPMNLRSAMQKYARGGDVKRSSGSDVSLDNYSNYSAKQNHEYRNIPGVGDNILLFWDHANKRVVVSDEGYWNKDSPVGNKLKKAVEWAHNQGYQAGVVVSPYSSDRFGDGVTTTAGGQPRKIAGATDQQLRDYVDAADFVVTDPYIVSQATATPEMQDNFANFTKNVGDYANSQGKDTWLFLQGFGTKDVDPKIVEDYNNRLVTENAGRYNDMSFFNLSDFGFAPGESVETFGDTIYQLNTKGAVDTATQAAQPFKMAEKTGLDLPADWNNYNSKDKINWFNEKNVSPDTLAQSGVAQGDIDWMMQNGYTGNTAQQQPQRMMAQARPQEMTGIAALGGNDGGLPEPTPKDGYSQAYVPPYTGPRSKVPDVLGSPYASKEDIEAFNRSLYVPNPNEYGRPQIAAPEPTYNPASMFGGSGNLGNDSPMGPYTIEGDYAMPGFQGTGQPIQKSDSGNTVYGGSGNLGNDSPMTYGPDPMPQTGGYDQPPPAQRQTDDYLSQFNNPMMGQTPTPAAPDYSRSYAALGGADTVNNLRNQFLGMGLDENTIGSIFSQYYAPEQPVQQMARGGMAHSNIEQYLTRLGMVRK